MLGQTGRTVRVRDLARRLEVSCPTVVAALAALEQKGLVEHERYGGVELTGRGRDVAGEVDGRHRLLERLLAEVLGVSPAVAAADACRLEHALSSESTARLRVFIQRRVRDKTG